MFVHLSGVLQVCRQQTVNATELTSTTDQTRMTVRLPSPLAILLVLCLHGSVLHGAGNTSTILTDALVFHGPDILGKEHVDVYVAVPYQLMQFQIYGGRYAATLTAAIVVRDSVNQKVADTTIKRSRAEDSYAVTQGSTGAAETMVARFSLKRGSYTIETTVTDQFSRRERRRTDSVVVPDLSNTPSISSLMYVSQIEDHNGRYSITPYIGSNVWSTSQQLFAFFEYYTVELPTEVGMSWQIATVDGKVLGGGLLPVATIRSRTSQHFFPIRLGDKPTPGVHTLTVRIHPVVAGVTDTSVSVASASRKYIIPGTLTSKVTSSLATAIRQLAYVANQADIDRIDAAKTEEDKTLLFEDFWKSLDPTKRTVRNEAFEEYYGRIATANTLFKSYAEGWMTDMGRVYVIYGAPAQKDQVPSQYGTPLLERWTYPNGQVFVFEDTGFGDFRLRTPLPAGIKYQYR